MFADQSDTNNRDLDKKTWIPPPLTTHTHALICYRFRTVEKKLMCVQNSSRFLV